MVLPKIVNDIENRVKDTGDTMTDNLYIKNNSYPGVCFDNTATGSRAIVSGWENSAVMQSINVAGTSNNRRALMLRNSAVSAEIKDALMIRNWIDGVSTDYKLYGTHNKPTAADVGALSLSGGTLTGNVIINKEGNPFLGLNDGTNYWYF